MQHNCWCICHDTDTEIHHIGVSIYDKIEAVTACSKCDAKHRRVPRVVRKSPLQRLLSWREYIGEDDGC